MMTDTEAKIRNVCQELAEFLVDKNRSYGDAALNPLRVFSKANPEEAIRVRLDDKLNRLFKGDNSQNEDTEWDLAGYLILLFVAQGRGHPKAPRRSEETPNACPPADDVKALREDPSRPIAKVHYRPSPYLGDDGPGAPSNE